MTITYQPLNTEGFEPLGFPIQVKLDGTITGLIRKSVNGFRYHPKGGKPGDAFHTLDECKASLEAE